MTREEKKNAIAEKRAAAKAKREAKKIARIERLIKIREAKKLRREAKKQKRLARLEKEKAKRLALREKKRLAREKKLALATASKIKMSRKSPTNASTTNASTTDVIDIRDAAKNMKKALATIATNMAALEPDVRSKKIKALNALGYDVQTDGNEIVVGFIYVKGKKAKFGTDAVEQPNKNDAIEVEVMPSDPLEIESIDDNATPVEIPVGDTYAADGNIDENDVVDDDNDNIDDEDDEDDEEIYDHRDEQDEDLIESRREFFTMYGEEE